MLRLNNQIVPENFMMIFFIKSHRESMFQESSKRLDIQAIADIFKEKHQVKQIILLINGFLARFSL